MVRKISETNKGHVNAFIRDAESNNLSQKRISKYMDVLVILDRELKKDFRKVDKEDMKDFMTWLHKSKYRPWSKWSIVQVTKVFYKWLYVSEDLPECVKWIKIPKPKNDRLPNELLSEDEMLSMINATKNPMHRAMLAILTETGCRVGELVNIKIQDIKFGDRISYLDLFGKTGHRRIPIMFSVPYISQWLECHPQRGNETSFLLMNGLMGQVGHVGVNKVIKKIGKKAKIHKRLYPHLFRHSAATLKASKWPEAMLKKFFGWTDESKMTSTYVHLSASDLTNAVMEMNGVETKRQESKLKPKDCMLCKEMNTPGAITCKRCGRPLEQNKAMEEMQKMERAYDFLEGIRVLAEEKPELMAMLKSITESRGG